MNSGLRLAAAVHCLIVAIAGIGCSGTPADQPDLAPVTGTVTLDGSPLPGVTVAFESTGGQVAFGETNEAGQYELVYKGPWKGAVLGQNTVRITTVTDAPPGGGWRDPVHPYYNVRSMLTAEVVEGENTFDFALEKKPKKP